MAAVLIAAATVASAAPAGSEDGPVAGALTAADRGESFTTREKPLRVTLISDSALAAISWSGSIGLLDPTLIWDARLESCRRIEYRSCRGRFGYKPPTLHDELVAIAAAGGAVEGDVLLVSVGHNDWDSRFPGDLEIVLGAARAAGYDRVGWLTYRENVSYQLSRWSSKANYAAMNAALRSAAGSGRWPELVVVDYAAFTSGHPDWFASDGVHLRSDGTLAVIEWLNTIINYSTTPALAPDDWRAE